MKKVIICIVAVILFIISFTIVRYFNVNPYQLRFGQTHTSLFYLRDHISNYKKETGSFPESLLEMKQYFESKESYSYKKTNKEYISYEEGSNQEHNTLNGKGGWYYNNETGKIAVNISKPLKSCFRNYYYSNRNQIPSEW